MGLTETAAREREREREWQIQPFPQPMGAKQDCDRTECMALLLWFCKAPLFTTPQLMSLHTESEISAHSKIITTSRCVNYVYILPPNFSSIIIFWGLGSIFCIFGIRSIICYILYRAFLGTQSALHSKGGISSSSTNVSIPLDDATAAIVRQNTPHTPAYWWRGDRVMQPISVWL